MAAAQVPGAFVGELWVSNREWAWNPTNAAHFSVVVNLSRVQTRGDRTNSTGASHALFCNSS